MILEGRLGDYDENYHRKNNKVIWRDDLDKPKYEPNPDIRHNTSQKHYLNKISKDVSNIA